jgi:hypothetical protein
MIYKAIPTTTFLQPKSAQQSGLFKEISITAGATTIQAGTNNRVIHLNQMPPQYAVALMGNGGGPVASASCKDSETEEMFGSSELNSMPPTNFHPSRPASTTKPNGNKRVLPQATFGYEPRVPTVTVAPHMGASIDENMPPKGSEGISDRHNCGSSLVEVEGAGDYDLD